MYCTDAPNQINYVLAIKDIQPSGQNEKISIVAKAFNESAMDIFAGVKAKPIGDFTAPVFTNERNTSCDSRNTSPAEIEFYFTDPESVYTVDANMSVAADLPVSFCYSVDSSENSVVIPCKSSISILRSQVRPNDTQGAVIRIGYSDSQILLFIKATNTYGLETMRNSYFYRKDCRILPF